MPLGKNLWEILVERCIERIIWKCDSKDYDGDDILL